MVTREEEIYRKEQAQQNQANMKDIGGGCSSIPTQEYSLALHNARKLEEEAAKLRRYDALCNKFGREIIELIELHMDLKTYRKGY